MKRPGGSGVKGQITTMPRPWTAACEAELIQRRAAGETKAECARAMGRSFASVENKVSDLVARGLMPRSQAPFRTKPTKPRPLDATVAAKATGQREWAINEQGASLTAYTFEPVRTLEDLCTICAVDDKVWEPVGLVCNAWGGGSVEEPRTLWQVKARFKRRVRLDATATITALADGVMAARKAAPAIKATRMIRQHAAQVLVIADPHFGKLCWSRGTGDADYDVDIAYRTLVDGALSLMRGVSCEKRYVVSLGDFFHFDTLGGTTTGGTVVDRDSRVPKILEVGADALARIVRTSAASAETELVIVPGNHDEVLSAALQRIMVAEFRRSTVTVDDTHTRRKARLYGRNLLGFNHGDKRKKELCASLAIEHSEAWGQSRYREIHTGHLHSEGERYEGTITHAGVTLRTHRTLSPPDAWHSDENFIGAPRGMSAWMYDVRGGLIGMAMYSPDVEQAA